MLKFTSNAWMQVLAIIIIIVIFYTPGSKDPGG